MCGQACCTPRRAFKKDATNQQDQSCSVGKLLHATALVVLVSRTDWRREVREAAARLQGEGEDRPVELAPAPGVDEDGGREGGGAAEMQEGREAESGRAALIGRAPPDGESAKV